MKKKFSAPIFSRILVKVLVAFSFFPSFSLAGDATFSADGQRIYLNASLDNKSGLRVIDLSAQTSQIIPLPQLGNNDWLSGVAATTDGTIFLTSRKSLWTFDPRTHRLSKVTDAGKSGNFYGLAYDPKSRRLCVSAEHGLFLLKNGHDLASVWVRRHSNVAYPTFASSGELFYAVNGDLWHGRIEPDDYRGYSLSAYRYAPLASPETANTTPAEAGVRDIAVLRDTIYVQIGRMGGSGYGWLLQLARPQAQDNPSEEFGGPIAPTDCLHMYQTALQSAKVVGENNYQSNLCVSPDETRLYYSNRHAEGEEEDWLVINGQPQQLHLAVIQSPNSSAGGGVEQDNSAGKPSEAGKKASPSNSVPPAKGTKRRQAVPERERVYQGRPD